MIVLGIDPGLASLGWGVIETNSGRHKCLGYGVINTSSQERQEKRLLLIFNKLKEILDHFNPTQAGIETLFFVKNITSAIPVAEVRGVVQLSLSQRGVLVGNYNPTEIKNALVGIGRAEKHQVQEMVKLLLGLKEIPKPDHAADALAAAICHAHNHPKEELYVE